MKLTGTIIVTAICTCAAWAQEPAANPQTQRAPVQMSQPQRLDFAGIQLALPADVKLQTPSTPVAVILGQRLENDQPVVSVSLVAMPVDKDLKLADFVKSVGPNPEDFSKIRVTAMRNLKIIRSEPARVAAAEGELRLMSYTLRAIDTVAVRLYFLRADESAGIKMGYALTVEAPRPRSKELLPNLTAIVKTIELFKPTHPNLTNIAFSAEPIASTRYGYAVKPPMWWKVQQEGPNLVMYQLDYLLGGSKLPTAALITTPAADLASSPENSTDANTNTPAQVAKKGIDNMIDALRQQKRELKPVRQRETKMADRDAFEIIACEELPLSQASDGNGRFIFAAQRSIVADGKSYSLTLVAQAAKVETIVDAMDALAANVSLVSESAVQPAEPLPMTAPEAPSTSTAPATAPAGEDASLEDLLKSNKPAPQGDDSSQKLITAPAKD